MGKHEVTIGQWKAVMGNNPTNIEDERRPVGYVSWNNCHDFIRVLKQRNPGLMPALPTEAQWEYACRAGTDEDCYYYGTKTTLPQHAWYQGNAYMATHPVGSKLPNPWGLYDMYGNVWEWCSDWPRTYTADTVADPVGKPIFPHWTVFGPAFRGGGYGSDSHDCRSARRANGEATDKYPGLGFRLICAIQDAE